MPPRFTFRLQPVLDQRERIEQEHTLAVAKLERERLAAEDRLRNAQQQIAAAKLDLRSRLAPAGASNDPAAPGLVIVPDVRLQANASLHLTLRAQQAALELAGAYRRLELARAALLKAATARKAVDLLKQRRREEWALTNKRAEAAQTDELNTTRYGQAGELS